MTRKNIMQVIQGLKDQKSATVTKEKIDIIDEQLRIADEYGLEDYE